MRIPVHRLDKEEILKTNPIADRVPDWFFRLDEASNFHWVAEGIDLWGRKVFREGGNQDEVFEACLQDARDLQRQIDEHR